jgi:hypothetical protein
MPSIAGSYLPCSEIKRSSGRSAFFEPVPTRRVYFQAQKPVNVWFQAFYNGFAPDGGFDWSLCLSVKLLSSK